MSMSFPKQNPTRSFWLNENPLAKYRTTPELPDNANIVIIGLGLTGTGALFTLSQKHPDLCITVLEARDPASGATGRNGGHLTPSAFRNFRSQSKIFGAKAAYLKCLLERHNADQLVKLIHDRSISCDLQEGTGNLECFFDAKEFAEAKLDLEAYREADKQFGGHLVDDIEVWEKETVTQRMGLTDAYGAILIPAHQLWPAKLCWSIQQECFNNPNVNIQSNTPATNITRLKNSNKWQVKTPRGIITCDVVLHASNAWSGRLLPTQISKILVPTRAQVLAFRSPQDDTVKIEEWTRGFTVHNGSEYMIRRRQDGTYILGGGRTYIPGQQMYEDDDSVLNEAVGKALRNVMLGDFPSLLPNHEEAYQEWTGIMCYTLDGLPVIGEVPDVSGQYVAIGYNGHGMPFGFQSGAYIADQAAFYVKGGKSLHSNDFEKHDLIMEAWRQYDPNRFQNHVSSKQVPTTLQPSVCFNSSFYDRLKLRKHWMVLTLLLMLIIQVAYCCCQ
ncbi:hypothetical protein NQZ79_g4074 [Umbelopsis isabellina]|nr:hypothetical protein NQZ79_g4074 [Umbelopsis isabellina]